MTITPPPRLAVGSHSNGSGFACAANVLCWEQGEPITDEPTGVSPYLAEVVRYLNDHICTEPEQDGWVTLLCPDCSTAVLDMAHRTLGTDVGDYSTQWFDELVGNERYGLRGGDPANTARLDATASDLVAGNAVIISPYEDSLPEGDSGYERYRRLLAMCVPAYYGRMFMRVHTGTDVPSVEAAHLLVDAWETVTGHRSTAPSPDVVQRALRESGANR